MIARALGAAIAAIGLALPAQAQLTRISGGVEASNPQVRLRVEAVAPDIIRVRVSDPSRPAPEDASWAVLPRVRTARATVTYDSTGFSTASGRVAIDPATLAVTIRDAAGKVVLADAPGASPVGASGFTLAKAMPTGQRIFGLGDKTGGLDRAGKSYVNWNTDAFGFDRATDPIYKSIPFYIATGGNAPTYGLLLDNTWRSWFDFGHRNDNRIAIGADGGSADYYVLLGNNVRDIVRGYARLTGPSPMPPRWSLGYQQSRYSYMTSTEVRELVDRFAAERHPLDVVWLDIDYQDRNRPFTIDRKAFPDFEKLVGELKTRGISTVPIVDLHIAAAPNETYAPYDSGLAGNHFTRRADGSLYVAPVWPGPSVFPDFTNEATRAWWGPLFKQLTDAGVAGIWNDMNEVAIFETPTKTMPIDNLHRIAGTGFAPRDATHAEVHNVIGMENSRATFDGLLKLRPNQRPFVMTRASYAGGHRYAATWTGDNNATWDHLKLGVAQLLNLGLSGFAWSGTDIGGFTGSPSPDLLTRWTQVAAFTPVMRNHSAKNTPRVEPWVDGPQHLAIRKRYAEARYQLMPYLEMLAEETARTGDPVMRPIFYDYDEAGGCDGSLQFTLGGRLLIAGNPRPESPRPYEACLPAGGWYDYWTGKRVTEARPSLTPTIETLPVYVRAGSIIAHQPLVANTSQRPNGPLELHVYPGPDCAGTLYDDDGISVRGPTRRQAVTCDLATDGKVTLAFARPVGSYRPWWKQVTIIVHGDGGTRQRTIPTPRGAASLTL